MSMSGLFQGGDFVDLLAVQGKTTGANWKFSGKVSKQFDSQLKGYVFVLQGATNAASKALFTLSATASSSSSARSMALTQRFLVLTICVSAKKSFCLEIGVCDASAKSVSKRRLVFATGFRDITRTSLHVQIPFVVQRVEQWIHLVFDVASLAQRHFGDGGGTSSSNGSFAVESICLSGNCRLKRVFTMKDAPRLSELEGTEFVPSKFLLRGQQLVARNAVFTDIPKQLLPTTSANALVVPVEYFLVSLVDGKPHETTGVMTALPVGTAAAMATSSTPSTSRQISQKRPTSSTWTSRTPSASSSTRTSTVVEKNRLATATTSRNAMEKKTSRTANRATQRTPMSSRSSRGELQTRSPAQNSLQPPSSTVSSRNNRLYGASEETEVPQQSVTGTATPKSHSRTRKSPHQKAEEVTMTDQARNLTSSSSSMRGSKLHLDGVMTTTALSGPRVSQLDGTKALSLSVVHNEWNDKTLRRTTQEHTAAEDEEDVYDEYLSAERARATGASGDDVVSEKRKRIMSQIQLKLDLMLDDNGVVEDGKSNDSRSQYEKEDRNSLESNCADVDDANKTEEPIARGLGQEEEDEEESKDNQRSPLVVQAMTTLRTSQKNSSRDKLATSQLRMSPMDWRIDPIPLVPNNKEDTTESKAKTLDATNVKSLNENQVIEHLSLTHQSSHMPKQDFRRSASSPPPEDEEEKQEEKEENDGDDVVCHDGKPDEKQETQRDLLGRDLGMEPGRDQVHASIRKSHASITSKTPFLSTMPPQPSVRQSDYIQPLDLMRKSAPSSSSSRTSAGQLAVSPTTHEGIPTSETHLHEEKDEEEDDPDLSFDLTEDLKDVNRSMELSYCSSASSESPHGVVRQAQQGILIDEEIDAEEASQQSGEQQQQQEEEEEEDLSFDFEEELQQPSDSQEDQQHPETSESPPKQPESPFQGEPTPKQQQNHPQVEEELVTAHEEEEEEEEVEELRLHESSKAVRQSTALSDMNSRIKSLLESTDWTSLNQQDQLVRQSHQATSKRLLAVSQARSSTSGTTSAIKGDSNALELVYDPILRCYFDPVHQKYYALK